MWFALAFEIFGFAGAILVAVAYVPQILHLYREKCSFGISLTAWIIWLVAALLIGVHALTTGDGVFILLQAINLVAIGLTAFFAKTYEGHACESHFVAKRERRT